MRISTRPYATPKARPSKPLAANYVLVVWIELIATAEGRGWREATAVTEGNGNERTERKKGWFCPGPRRAVMK